MDTSDSDWAISNVSCQYDSPSDTDDAPRPAAPAPPGDHTYDTRDEPPAFIIHQINNPSQLTDAPAPYVEVSPKIMTIGPGLPAVNVIHVGDRPHATMSQSQPEYNINKRIRRSEDVLRRAADCVSRGLTFQTVSEQFNIPISTIRFFMARKGILPQRRRGRSTQVTRSYTSPEPPFHMQHYKLPAELGLRPDDADSHPGDSAT